MVNLRPRVVLKPRGSCTQSLGWDLLANVITIDDINEKVKRSNTHQSTAGTQNAAILDVEIALRHVCVLVGLVLEIKVEEKENRGNEWVHHV